MTHWKRPELLLIYHKTNHQGQLGFSVAQAEVLAGTPSVPLLPEPAGTKSPPFVPRPVATASEPFIPKPAENPQNPVTTTNRIPLVNAIRLEEQEPRNELRDSLGSTTSQRSRDQSSSTTSQRSREPPRTTTLQRTREQESTTTSHRS